jgi:Raf kinase inhibitor-like YbhB/YbcL family protein
VRAGTLAIVVGLLAGGGGGDDGDDDGPTIDAATIDAAADELDAAADELDADVAEMTLTSADLVRDGAIASELTCDGDDRSPVLSWSGAPRETAGFVVTLVDLSNELPHWAIWDLADDASGLPADVENAYAPEVPAGAHQALSYDGTTRGYRGPCPGKEHTYQFSVYALDVAAPAGLGMASTRDEVIAGLDGHVLAVGRLTGTYDPR